MIWKRTCYLILTLASVVAFILTDSGVALFFMLCLFAFPILSFALLFAAKRRFIFGFTVRRSCIRGGALQITMQAGLFPRFLAGYVSATGVMENTTFGKSERKRFIFQDMSNSPHTYDYVSADSGRIVVRFPKIRLVDVLGICSVSVKCNKYVEATVSPVLYDEANVRIANRGSNALAGEFSIAKKGSDHTEIFGIRDYRPGDLLNSVHWKLSGKFDDLKTKEYGSSDDRHTLVLVDMTRIRRGEASTSDEWLNCVLDIASSVSGALIKNGYAHTVGWFNEGKFYCAEITDNDSFVLAVEKLMSDKISESETSDLYFMRSPECAVFTKIIYVAAATDIAVARENAGCDLTVLSVNESAVTIDNGATKFIGMPCNGILTALSACEL